MSGGEHFCYSVPLLSLSLSYFKAQPRRKEKRNEFLAEIIKEVGTVLIDVLVLIAEEIENND